MVAQLKSQVYNGSGEGVWLGGEIARGGEGRILNIRNRPDLVAKVYHRPIDLEKATKLTAMVSLKTERLLNLTAWPVDTLHDFNGGPVSGFLMPRIIGHKNIHVLYGVKSRNAEYPEARWPFLIQSAANVARAFAVIHEHGHVIGDVNHASLVASKRATVRLVDCDSFQIMAQGQQFLCEVGTITHLPPELQGRLLHGIVRTADHDAFGLAVIIFQLLFMGRHPFSGTSLGPEDIALERAIKEHRFAYGADAESRQMRQPPASLRLDAVSPQIASMFEQAFLSGNNRPSARSWVTALTEMSEDLQRCTQEPAHYFINSITSCPWCEIESRSGIILFRNAVMDTANDFFDMVKTWVEILSVKPPSMDNLPAKSSVEPADPSWESQSVIKERHWKSFWPILYLTSASVILFSVHFGTYASFLILTCILLSTLRRIYKVTLNARQELVKLKDKTEQKLLQADQWWKDNGQVESFSRAVSELAHKKAEYENLSKLRTQRLDDLQKIVWERQFYDFLSAQRLLDTEIPHIRQAHIVALRSCGIETARDITEGSIKNISGLEADQVNSLIGWRKTLTMEFNDRPKPIADTDDLASIESEILNIRLKLQTDLRNGPAYLRQLSRRGQSVVETGRPEVLNCLAQTAQAEEDVRNCTSKKWVALAVSIYVVNLFLFCTGDYSGHRPVVLPKIAVDYGVPNPSSPATINYGDLPKNKKAAALYDQAVHFQSVGDDSNALVLVNQALAIQPNLPGANRLLGQLLYKQQYYREASYAFNQATTNDARDAVASAGLGLSMLALNKPVDAINALQTAVSLDPKNAMYHYNLGLSYKAYGDNQSAVEAFKNSIRFNPKDANSHYEEGLASIAVGDFEQATKEYGELNLLNKTLARKLYLKLQEAKTPH